MKNEEKTPKEQQVEALHISDVFCEHLQHCT